MVPEIDRPTTIVVFCLILVTLVSFGELLTYFFSGLVKQPHLTAPLCLKKKCGFFPTKITQL